MFEALGCFYQVCPGQEFRPFPTEKDIQCGSKKKELDELRRSFIQEKASLSLKYGSVKNGNSTRQVVMSKNLSEKTFLTDVDQQLSDH